MRFRLILAAAGVTATLAAASPVSAQVTLNVVTAGDQNMVDYVNNYLGPKFEAANPGVKVRAVGTGPGDSGSQKIYEKLSAQQKAGAASSGGAGARALGGGGGGGRPGVWGEKKSQEAPAAKEGAGPAPGAVPAAAPPRRAP